ncbi:acyl-CoA-binding domain-containing protein 2-like [Strongylocentrotus purpuratus]|uniref:Uncharacterized protein n=1 Tax=Strongylocentrotus purpuratus TaxID=7668 RepID=A0A7M7PBV2_STRPU|nr:acyl-CoA-binding domain-containing protein 2-like [Strongylocentrotus purpuratus]
MKNLLDRKAVMSTRLSRRGQSPISIALSFGNADTARVLLDKDATSIHHSDSAGLTPIHLATVSGLSSIIEELVSLGADVNPQSHDGQTPLHFAIRLCRCKKRQVEVTTALQQIQQESDDDLSPAEALIQFLINQGSKVDIKDNEGFTPVQYARDERVRQMVLRR